MVLETESEEYASIRRMPSRVVEAQWFPQDCLCCVAGCRRKSLALGAKLGHLIPIRCTALLLDWLSLLHQHGCNSRHGSYRSAAVVLSLSF